MRSALRVLCWAAVGLLWVSGAHAGAFDLNDESWEGCTELLSLARRELGQERVIVRAVLDWEDLKSNDGLLVMHPVRQLDAEEAAEFMKDGGRLAVVDDFGAGDKLLRHFKIHRISLPTRPQFFLRNNPAIAVAEPSLDLTDGQVHGLHPTVAQVDRVVLNHGSGWRHPDLTPVLEVRGIGEDPVTVAVAAQVDQGRLYAVGDSSVFINQMLRYPGNRELAAGLVRYLADGDRSRLRRGRLFIMVNDFEEKGAYGGVTPLRKSLDRQLKALLEALVDMRDNGFPWWLHLGIAAVVALLVLVWVVRALGRMYHSRVPPFARLAPLVAQGGIAGKIAVLSAPSSPAALALLELRETLVEALSLKLGQPGGGPVELLQQARQQGLIGAAAEARLTAALALMKRAEQAVVTSSPTRIGRRELLRTGAAVSEVLAACGVGLRGLPAASGEAPPAEPAGEAATAVAPSPA